MTMCDFEITDDDGCYYIYRAATEQEARDMHAENIGTTVESVECNEPWA